MNPWPSTKARLVLAALLRIGWTVTVHRLLVFTVAVSVAEA